MAKKIIKEFKKKKDGEKVLFSIGLEIGLGLKTFDDIIKSCENFNEENFGNKNGYAECPCAKSNVIKFNRYDKNRLQKNKT